MDIDQLDVLDKLPNRVQAGNNLSQSSEKNKFAAKLQGKKHITELQKHTKYISSKIGTTITPTEFQLNFDGKKQHTVHRRTRIFAEGKKLMGGTCLIHKSAMGFNHSKINKTTEMKAKLSASQEFSEAPNSTNLSKIQVSQT